YIDMELGGGEGERLEEGSYIATEPGEGFDALAKDASAVLKEVKDIAKTIKEALRDEQGKNVIKEIVGNINDMTASLKRITTGNEGKINQIVDDIKALSEQLAYETDRYQKDS